MSRGNYKLLNHYHAVLNGNDGISYFLDNTSTRWLYQLGLDEMYLIYDDTGTDY